MKQINIAFILRDSSIWIIWKPNMYSCIYLCDGFPSLSQKFYCQLHYGQSRTRQTFMYRKILIFRDYLLKSFCLYYNIALTYEISHSFCKPLQLWILKGLGIEKDRQIKLNHHPRKDGSESQVAAAYRDSHHHGIDLRHWESMCGALLQFQLLRR